MQLHAISKSFVIRRDASILTNYLPPKRTNSAVAAPLHISQFQLDEYTVFVTPTELQLQMFSKLLLERHINRVTHGHTANALAMIRTLTRLSTSPMLLQRKDDAVADDPVGEALALVPEKTAIDDVSISGRSAKVCSTSTDFLSGKLSLLAKILSILRKVRTVAERRYVSDFAS